MTSFQKCESEKKKKPLLIELTLNVLCKAIIEKIPHKKKMKLDDDKYTTKIKTYLNKKNMKLNRHAYFNKKHTGLFDKFIKSLLRKKYPDPKLLFISKKKIGKLITTDRQRKKFEKLLKRIREDYKK